MNNIQCIIGAKCQGTGVHKDRVFKIAITQLQTNKYITSAVFRMSFLIRLKIDLLCMY